MTLPAGSVAAYLRISIDRTGDAASPQRQGKRARQLARQHGLPAPVDYLEPGSTSATKKRGKNSAYARLLDDVRAGHVRVVIVWDLDRLTRHPAELEEWLGLCEKHGLRLITMDGECDTTTANGRLFLRIRASVARHEVEHKAARQRDANRDRAEAGQPWRSSRRTFGYTRDFAVIPAEADLVREAFTDVLAGTSLRTITRRLNAAGVKTTQGGTWTTAGLRIILRNPTYKGRRRLNGVEVADLKGVQAIVDADTFAAVQTIVNDPARLTSDRGGRGPQHLLSGVARCGICGAKMDAGTASSRGRPPYRVWRCTVGFHLSRKAEPIEEYVTEVVLARLRRPDAAKLFRSAAPDLAPLRARAKELRRQREALAGDLDVDLAFAKARDRRLRDELDRVETEIAAKSGKSALAAFATGRDPDKVWAELDLDARREVVRELVDVKVLPAGRGRVTPFDPTTAVKVMPRKTARSA